MKFKDFNDAVNKDNLNCYVGLHNGQPIDSKLTAVGFSTIFQQAVSDDALEIGWIIPKGFAVIETETKALLPLIITRIEPLFVFENSTKLFIVAKSSYDRTTTNNMLTCGVSASTKAYSRAKTIQILPFKKATTTSPNLMDMKISYYSGVLDEFPHWLYPIFKITKIGAQHTLNLPLTTDAHKKLREHLFTLRLAPLMTEERIDVIKTINQHFNTSPLTKDELDNVIEGGMTDLITQEFFNDGGEFLHNKMGDYLIQAVNIKRDFNSKQLYFFDEKKKIYVNDEDFLMGYITRLCPWLKDFQKQEVMKYIKSYLAIEPAEFNANPFTVVFKNGILDLTDLSFREMTTNDLETIRLNVCYNPKAASKVADDYFKVATDNKMDIETLLYEAIGYTMLKTSELQKAFILVGTGRNGKSTYLEIIRNILGAENTTAVAFRDLTNNFRAADLYGKLASLAGDISNTPLTESDMIKSIISGDMVTIEKKYQHAHSATLFATIIASANTLPRTPDTSMGFYRRLCIIPFIANLESVKQVDGMAFKKNLFSQETLEYIAYKSVQAIYNVLNNTREFTEPQAVKDMLKKYKEENSSVLAWIADRYSDIEDLVDRYVSELYRDYTTWSIDAGYKRFRSSRFAEELVNECKFEINKSNKIIGIKKK